MSEIYDSLQRLHHSKQYPFHMPGHKRQGGENPLADIYDIDITEIDDFDNLHDPEGLILRAEERCNSIYGADESFFMVNGSTGGILSAISAVTMKGDKIAASRNSHRSFYNAAYINCLEVDYIYPEMNRELGLCSSIKPEEVKRVLDSDRELRAVFITSPTYEGITSDIAQIADIVHSQGIPLIVDEAHGAHFGFSKDVPDGAIHQGADIVIHSTHKTLPAMTQTALLHVQGSIVDRGRLKKFLKIFQTSSPSYVFMASIDLCMDMLDSYSSQWFAKLLMYNKKIIAETAVCRYIRVLDNKLIDDPAKIVICSLIDKFSGNDLYDIFRKRYHLQPEMASERYILMIITGNDSDSGIDRLIDAILDINNRIGNYGIESLKQNMNNEITNPRIQSVKQNINNGIKNTEIKNIEIKNTRIINTGIQSVQKSDLDFNLNIKSSNKSPINIPIYKAYDADSEFVEIENANGRTAADFIYVYPPGIPLIAPGEVFTEELVNIISDKIKYNLNVKGIELSENNKYSVKVCKNIDEV